MSRHPLYHWLQCTTDILAENEIFYVLSSGTLLGAVRESALIGHDTDFDIEILAPDLPRLRGLQKDFAKYGLTLSDNMIRGIGIHDGTRATAARSFVSTVWVLHEGRHVGDIFVFTIFNDGLARRYDPNTRTFANPRHQHPAWYYEQLALADLYGDSYPIMRDAWMVLESMYGPEWTRPITPGEHGPGRHERGGAIRDRDLERVINHAIASGWDSDYSGCPIWPPTITHVNSNLARWWIIQNEPLVDLTGRVTERLPLSLPGDVGIANAMSARNQAVRALRQATAAARVLESEAASREAAKLKEARRHLAEQQSKLEETSRRLAEQQSKLRLLRRNPIAFLYRYAIRKLRA